MRKVGDLYYCQLATRPFWGWRRCRSLVADGSVVTLFNLLSADRHLARWAIQPDDETVHEGDHDGWRACIAHNAQFERAGGCVDKAVGAPRADRKAGILATCRYCGEPKVKPPSRTFCSPACVHEWAIRSNPGYLRQQVEKRDKGECWECERNTRADRDEMRKLFPWKSQNPLFLTAAQRRAAGWREPVGLWHDDWLLPDGTPAPKQYQEIHHNWQDVQKARGDWLEQKGYPRRLSQDTLHWFEADHIKPVSEGGAQSGLAGVRTLCLMCHGVETGKLRKRLNARLADARAAELKILENRDA